MEISRERRIVRPETTNTLKDPVRQIHRHNLMKTNSLPLRRLLKKGARNNRKTSGIDDSVPIRRYKRHFPDCSRRYGLYYSFLAAMNRPMAFFAEIVLRAYCRRGGGWATPRSHFISSRSFARVFKVTSLSKPWGGLLYWTSHCRYLGKVQ
jgi:hypothetical protein